MIITKLIYLVCLERRDVFIKNVQIPTQLPKCTVGCSTVKTCFTDIDFPKKQVKLGRSYTARG